MSNKKYPDCKANGFGFSESELDEFQHHGINGKRVLKDLPINGEANSTESAVINLLLDSCESKGRQAKYVRVGNGVGIKFFLFDDERDHAFTQQLIAFQHGFGPKPLGKIDLDHGEYLFGLYTEDVTTYWDFGVDKNVTSHENNLKYNNWKNEVDGDHDRRWTKLKQEWLNTFGVYYQDGHYGNVGITKDGRVVAIDFGDEHVDEKFLNQPSVSELTAMDTDDMLTTKEQEGQE